jgi:predicted MFS family arabinose efflux permease
VAAAVAAASCVAVVTDWAADPTGLGPWSTASLVRRLAGRRPAFEVPLAERDVNTTHSAWGAARTALTTLREAARTRAFWLLAGTFFVCGWTTNGIISTHFVPAMHDHGVTATTAASLLAIVGIFDLIGTIGSGWLTDRVDPRILLGIYYGLRGVALLALPIILGPNIDPPLIVVMILFGLDWVATVPPTAILCARIFGPERGPVVFGWVFASHMIGAAFAASVSGWMRDAMGDYASAWFLAGGLAVLAAIASLLIPARGRVTAAG